MTNEVAPPLAEALRDHYRLERELGRGGMATVWLARDLKHDRLVALKVLRADLSAILGGERFLREIRLTANLQHPHILPLHDSGTVGESLFYMMPYVEGESLRERLVRERQLSLGDTVRVTRGVASALDYAHQQGVIHRDIKPENILLNNQSEPMVADFGIAKALAISVDQLTETGLAIGTASYMSPEQATGEPVDARTDVYALGCVLYEMLTGEAPYTGPTAQAVAAKHLGAAIPSVRIMRPDVSPAVDACIRRALAKSPAARFTTAGELSSGFTAACGHDAPRSRMPVVGGAIAVLAAVLFWAVHERNPVQGAGHDPLPRLAVLPLRALGDSTALGFADGLTEELTQRLGTLGGLRVIASGSARRAAELKLSLRQAGESLGVAYLLTGTVRQSTGSDGLTRLRVAPHLVRAVDETEIWSQAFDTPLANVLDLQAAVAGDVARALSLTISDAERQRLAGRPPRDPRAYQLVLQARRAGPSSEAGRTALREAVRLDSAYGLAVYYLAAGEYELTQTVREQEPRGAVLTEVRRLLDRAIALDSTLYDAYEVKAHLALDADWDVDAAQRQVDELLRRNPSHAWGHTLNAWLLERRGRHNEAIAAMKEAVALDPLDPQLPVNLAWRFSFAGHFDSAEATLRRVLRTPSDSVTPLALWALGDALVAAGRPAEAVGPYTRWSESSARGNVSLAYLAWALSRAGQLRAAQELARELDSRRSDRYVSPVHLGIAWFAAGDTARSRSEFRVALREHAPLFGWLDGHPVFTALHRDPVVDSLLAEAGGWRVARRRGEAQSDH